jgi:hypothetical protein
MIFPDSLHNTTAGLHGPAREKPGTARSGSLLFLTIPEKGENSRQKGEKNDLS